MYAHTSPLHLSSFDDTSVSSEVPGPAYGSDKRFDFVPDLPAEDAVVVWTIGLDSAPILSSSGTLDSSPLTIPMRVRTMTSGRTVSEGLMLIQCECVRMCVRCSFRSVAVVFR